MLTHRPAVLLLLLLSTLPLAAQTPPLFEVVVSGARSQCAPSQPPNASGLQWFNPDRTDLSTDASTSIRGIASADGQRVFALERLPGPSFRVVEVRPDGSVTPLTAPVPGHDPVAIDVGTNGRIFVAAFQQTAPGFPYFLFVYSSAGVLEATFPIGTVSGFALAPDNCTIFYIGGPAIHRFNACTGTPLADFGPVDDYTDVEVLPDGRVLLLTESSVHLYAADGTLIRTIVANVQSAYGLGSSSIATEVAVSADLQTLFIAIAVNCNFASNGSLIRASFNTGAEISERDLVFQAINGLVVGAPGPAPGAGAANVPTASEWMLILLALTLAAVGVRHARI